MENKIAEKRTRDSNIEFLRILMMVVIVAHHYVVNSGIIQEFTPPQLSICKIGV